MLLDLSQEYPANYLQMPLQYSSIYIKEKDFYKNLLLLVEYLQFTKISEF
jgi:hypothetical protein